MKKLNVPTSQIAKFAGKWIVIDPKKEIVIAVGDNYDDISSLVTYTSSEKKLPVGEAPYSFLVPRKDEGPYILCNRML